MPTHTDSLNWGILGAADHARRFMAEAIQRQGGRIVAIAASTRERAVDFARAFGIPEALAGYDTLLARSDIDAVYIPLVNSLHFEWALACARAGKHCLCEKPMVLTLREARELRQAFTRADRRLVEAFMWRHHAHAAQVRQMLRAGAIGRLLRFHATHGFMLERRDGYRLKDEPGSGVLWDIGAYMADGARFFFETEPIAVSARGAPVRAGSRTDLSVVGWLDFGDQRLATFGCSYASAYRQEFVLVGETGSIQITRPLTNLKGPSIIRMEVDGKVTLDYPVMPTNPYEREVNHFARLVRDPALPLAPAEDGVAQAAVMEALATSAAQGGALQEVAKGVSP